MNHNNPKYRENYDNIFKKVKSMPKKKSKPRDKPKPKGGRGYQMDELYLTKKDFKLEWYSGSGAGGQHRNKHQNCCRITHIETGMCERGTESKSRVSNQKTAFMRLAKRVIQRFMVQNRINKEINTSVIRNYNEPRNEVYDKASGLKMPYTEIVVAGNIDKMIAARRISA